MKTSVNYRGLLKHGLSISLFISYEVLVALSMGSTASALDFAGFYLLDIPLFYLNAHVILSVSFQKKRGTTWRLVVGMLLELAAYILLTALVGAALLKIRGVTPPAFQMYDMIKAAWRGIYIVGFSTAYFFILRYIRNIKKMHEDMRKQIMLENATLRAQINPHFLYNTLSFINNSIQETAPEASRAVLLLAQVMRYAFDEVDADGKVALADEIAQIQRYIELNQARFSKKLNLQMQIEESCYDTALRIPPLLLLTFVENMFKYGNLSYERIPAEINIQFSEGWLHFYTENLIGNQSDISGNRLGLSNVNTRLKNFYPGKFNLQVHDNDGIFIIDLKIFL